MNGVGARNVKGPNGSSSGADYGSAPVGESRKRWRTGSITTWSMGMIFSSWSVGRLWSVAGDGLGQPTV